MCQRSSGMGLRAFPYTAVRVKSFPTGQRQPGLSLPRARFPRKSSVVSLWLLLRLSRRRNLPPTSLVECLGPPRLSRRQT